MARSQFESAIPEFTQSSRGEVSENHQDEKEILEDKDQTFPDENFDAMEDQPGDFARGEVDVKAQMDKAARALNSSIQGFESLDEDGESEGGLEEVAQKTDGALARARHH